VGSKLPRSSPRNAFRKSDTYSCSYNKDTLSPLEARGSPIDSSCGYLRVSARNHAMAREVFPQPPAVSSGDQRTSIQRPISVPVSPSSALECYPCREVPLNYNRLLLFHGGDTGSTPVRDVNFLCIRRLPRVSRPCHIPKFPNAAGRSYHRQREREPSTE
jgi:hypothetical protein